MRIKSEYLKSNVFANYDLTDEEFMEQSYIPHYQSSVQRNTWYSRECGLKQITSHFAYKKLRETTVTRLRELSHLAVNSK